jgi:DNA-binding response OmpR family regulator
MILLNNMTILIVDDTPTNVDLLSMVLKKRNYKVRVADSGERALKQINLQPPDLVLMDVMMPGMDGFETCRRMKQDPATADIPVIFITALSDMQDMLKGFQVGGADFLTKPFQAEEVLARVKAHLTIRKLHKDLSAKNEKLEKALEEVKTLQGIVPICCMCKKIRDDSGFWNQVEMYISKHVGTQFSHSYCPDCLEKEMKKLDGP